MKLTFLGHAAVRIEAGEHEILIDPFLKENPRAALGPDDVSPDYIVLTHGHGDHVGDTVELAERTGATVVSCPEICGWLGERGVESHAMNIGGPYQFPFGSVRFTPAWHSSSLPDGTYGGMPMGVVLEVGARRVYHAGDTALFSDMALIGELGLDVALLPIGGNFTMGPECAVRAAKLLRARRVVPIHYDTFPVIRQDAHAFKRKVEEETDSECVVLEPGQALPR